MSLTVYSPRGEPIVWAGRPAELPFAQHEAGETWFVVANQLGPRLAYVRAVADESDGRRLGTVTAEQALNAPTDLPVSTERSFTWEAAAAPVTIHLPGGVPPIGDQDTSFIVRDPAGGELGTAVLAGRDVSRARERWQERVRAAALSALVLTLLWLTGPLLDWRRGARTGGAHVRAALAIAGVIVVARGVLRFATPQSWAGWSLFAPAGPAPDRAFGLLASPFDLLMTATAAAGVAATCAALVEGLRLRRLVPRLPTHSEAIVAFVAVQVAAGEVLARLLRGYRTLLVDVLASTPLDPLHFSLHPWSAEGVALQAGLVIGHVAVAALALALLRLASLPFGLVRRSRARRAGAIACWVTPLMVWALVARADAPRVIGLALPLLLVAAGVLVGPRLATRLRRGSQAMRLATGAMVVILPPLAFYPTLFQIAWDARADVIESRFAAQAIAQRAVIQTALDEAIEQIDATAGLDALVAARPDEPAGVPDTDRAFSLWRRTSLSVPLTSSIELYGPTGVLESRFAFNLPEDLSAVRRREEPTCGWDVYEEVSPFFAEERRVLHAGRALCDAGGRREGSIVVHAMLDYGDLPFIASQSPYAALLRRDDPARGEDVFGRDVEYAVYGWSRMPLYSSRSAAWTLDDAAFDGAAASRRPFWTRLENGAQRFEVFMLNDRGGIHALGVPLPTTLDHVVNLGEVTALAGLTYVLALMAAAATGAVWRRNRSGRALLREMRASFYRKLFLAFVAAAVIPVVALAFVTRAYVAAQIRESIELEALRTASAARRVVEDLAAPQAEQRGLPVDDNLTVWASRLIGEDVNVFAGPRLVATSERNLFASGLLPTRTPADVYRDLALGMRASTVTRDRIGGLEYMVVGASMKPAGSTQLLTVPLTLRQQEVESEVDTLDRRVLLAVLVFVLAGAGIGYSMAERIADPVNRLTRATRRIARGDLGARITATSSDELRRLVEDFNSMADELERQRDALERTHRLEAWAEMARQVAHEIKNPLTPIQLNAEHLRRVHTDRGEPLGPVLRESVDTILGQVRLLRQIASEFSSFASAPVATLAPVHVGELVAEVIEPYRAGLAGRIGLDVQVPADLPPAHVDRTLIVRALVNIVENALHAMPGTGRLLVQAATEADASGQGRGVVRLEVSDTGQGMDAAAAGRAFEPYFSTKAAGTGLGLPIARRNVELCEGRIAIRSVPDQGTTVTITLPVAV
ncbi:MAG: HAMP domain-containing histidine kinase [Acidimicrobiia bacterium]|nr:HAMP domain-containing histidine kinase [Acidimicrobiia bacterium]